MMGLKWYGVDFTDQRGLTLEFFEMCKPNPPTQQTETVHISITTARMSSATSDITINNRLCAYAIRLDFGTCSDFTPDVFNQFNKVVLEWKRQTSPAPASATFGNVPTSHPFFQSIEAMAASGITGGCGGGNYCPNDSVTREQFAAFFARALRLHWSDL